MNKFLAIVAGVGFLALQGCAGAEYTGAEDVGVQSEALSSTCWGAQGVNPSKAALAVAMADELGRLDPLKDLVKVGGKVLLSSSAVCLKNACSKTKAILGQQYFTPDQNVFGATNYASDLFSSFDRQDNLIKDLKNNHPTQLPPAHKMTMVGSMTLTGACGPHYIFQVNNTNGTALTTAQATNMSNTLCFYGQDSGGMGCGNNPFVGFVQTQTGCPSGRVCVAIDPDDGDSGSGTTTTAGSAPTYTLNRLWNPDNSKLNTACITTGGVTTTLKSKCAAYPSTCGYLYCML